MNRLKLFRSMSRLFPLILLVGPLLFMSEAVDAGITNRVSIDSAEVQGNDWSYYPSISADGRYVAFSSVASNLVPMDTNGASDVFVRDRQTGATTRVSVDSSGVQGNGWSYYPSISADGRYVAFSSRASNLVTLDTNGASDIFVHDSLTGVTTRVSIDNMGGQGNNDSYNPMISGDGRYVAFSSIATNLVPGDTNGASDIFVHNRQTGITTRVSVDNTGVQGDDWSHFPSISSNGRYTAFYSHSVNLVPVGTDTNAVSDIFVHDLIGMLCNGKVPTIMGTNGNDVIAGTAGPDVIHGLGGNDKINGYGGNDLICGGTGSDILYG